MRPPWSGTFKRVYPLSSRLPVLIRPMRRASWWFVSTEQTFKSGAPHLTKDGKQTTDIHVLRERKIVNCFAHPHQGTETTWEIIISATLRAPGAGVSPNHLLKVCRPPAVDEGDARTPQGGILGARSSRKMRAQRFNDNSSAWYLICQLIRKLPPACEY